MTTPTTQTEEDLIMEFTTVAEALDFINGLDGSGLIVTDEELLIENLINCGLDEGEDLI